MDNIFESLNSKQAEAVRATEGRVRIVAGAGSGKTRVLAHRYAYIVNELGIDPANILCMTFTNKAAQEMKKRIAKLVTTAHVNDFVCTIHGFCVKVLRREIHRIGYPRNFKIIDEEDCKALAKQVMEEMGLDRTEVTTTQFLKSVAFYKAQKDNDYIGNIILGKHIPPPEEISQPERYVQLQLKGFMLDFQDLIAFTIYIFDHFEEAKRYWQNLLNYIMVDEVQDCSKTDWQIIDVLAEGHDNLFIVGDPDQAIYEWRGAKPDYFNQFKADTDIILNQNYRSTPNILDVANSVIKYNQNRIPKDLFTNNPKDKIALYHHAETEKDEGNWICKQILQIVQKGCSYSDIAILYRASYQSREIEQALLRNHVKYTVWGGIRFFERKEIKDALSYLRLVAYQDDDLAFTRVINTPSRKFGKVSLNNLIKLAKLENASLYETLKLHLHQKEFHKEPLIRFVHLIESSRELQSSMKISDLLDHLLQESGLKEELRMDEDEERLENVAELMNAIQHYEKANEHEQISLITYLQDIALYTNADYKNDGDTVRLMTIHQSKGLEFPYVFVCGLTEGIFPSHKSIRERKRSAEEEERRLMYVAITRAEKALFLTDSEGFDYTRKSSRYPSRFITEITEGLIKIDGHIDPSLFLQTKYLADKLCQEMAYAPSTANYNSPSDSSNTADKDILKPGDTVTHKVFGRGTILEYIESKGTYKIDFNSSIKFIRADFFSK